MPWGPVPTRNSRAETDLPSLTFTLRTSNPILEVRPIDAARKARHDFRFLVVSAEKRQAPRLQLAAERPRGSRSGPDRDRTDNLIHAMDALSQLSYRPVGIRLLGLSRPRSDGGRAAGEPGKVAGGGGVGKGCGAGARPHDAIRGSRPWASGEGNGRFRRGFGHRRRPTVIMSAPCPPIENLRSTPDPRPAA